MDASGARVSVEGVGRLGVDGKRAIWVWDCGTGAGSGEHVLGRERGGADEGKGEKEEREGRDEPSLGKHG